MADFDNPPATPTPTPGPLVSLERFLKSLKGTEDEIWGKLLRVEAKAKAMTVEAWKQFIAEIAARGAHPLHPDFNPDATKAPPAPANPKKMKK